MGERDWIESFPENLRGVAGTAVLYARAVNVGEVDALAERMAEGVSLESQSSFGGPAGRDQVASLLRRQAASRKAPVGGVTMALDVGTTPGDGRPCAIVYQSYGPLQQDWLRHPRCFVGLDLDGEGRLATATVVTVAPDPRHTRAAGIFPGLGGAPSVIPRIPGIRTQELRLLLFVGDGAGALDAGARSVCRRVEEEFRCPRAAEVTLMGEYSAEEEAVRERYRIEGWPALLVLHGGELLFRYVGLPGEEAVLADLRRVAAP